MKQLFFLMAVCMVAAVCSQGKAKHNVLPAPAVATKASAGTLVAAPPAVYSRHY